MKNDAYWAKEFEKELKKEAVQPKKQESLFDQINSIMNGKSKHQTVEAKVDEMKSRSGLTGYLEKKKTASENSKEPDIFNECPQIRMTIENFVRDSNGHLPIPAIIQKIKAIHQHDVTDDKLWNDEKLMKFVNELNTQHKKTKQNEGHSHNLGKTNYDIEDVDNEVFTFMK